MAAKLVTVEDWTRTSILGEGSFGVVSAWRNMITNEFLAIKMCRIRDKSTITPRQRERWNEEVAFMKKINHLNIVSFKALPEALDQFLSRHNPSELPILSMEYCTGGNMRYKLLEPQYSCGLFDTDVREVLGDINEAVSHLHRLNVIHRDIKPENIVLQRSDCRRSKVVYKLIDLGYAKENINTQASFVGTLNYLAPEIFKRDKYNVSVDYWSMGILFYEVICGMVPFLPDKAPIERFDFIRKKHPDHISIMMENDKPAYRDQMIDENHITPCLRRRIEAWLKHVLQYNSDKRKEPFSDGRNVFEHLNDILGKKVVTVYSLYTVDFHSYEIEETTSIGSLKEWIARDTDVPKEEQIILTGTRNYDDVLDNKLVVTLLSKDDTNLYVIKKGCFIKKELTLATTKAVSQLLTSVRESFSWSELKSLYTRTIHYILQEMKAMKAYETAFILSVDFVQNLFRKMRAKWEVLHYEMNTLIIRMDCYNNIRRSVENGRKLSGTKYRDILVNYKNLLTYIRQIKVQMDNFKHRIWFVGKSYQVFNEKKLRAQEIIQGSVNLEINLREAIRLFKESGQSRANNDLQCSGMCRIVSQVIKKKNNVLIKNAELKEFTSALTIILTNVERCLMWMAQCHPCIRNMSRSVDEVQVQIIKLLLQKTHQNKSISDEAAQLVEDNRNLRAAMLDKYNEIWCKHQQVCDITNNTFSQSLI